MPRRNLIRQDQFPYHVSSRSNNKDWFAIALNDVWIIAMKSFIHAQELYPIKLHAFVLMNNHYHMLLSTPDSNIDQFMQAFNKYFSEKLKIRSGRINKMFGGPYKWSIVDNEVYLYNVHRYIYQNPLRAEMVTSCEDFPFSSLTHQVQNKEFPIPLHQAIDFSHHQMLDWYNTKLEDKQVDGLRRGLKHAHCKVNPERDSKLTPSYDLPSIMN